MMTASKPTPVTPVAAAGELHERALANALRLERDVFEPAAMFERMAGNAWPGDTEGRLLLGLVVLAQALGREPETLGELLELWDDYTNERGYFGPVFAEHHEQQLSSHGWVLRGLCELHAWRGCAWSRERIETIVRELALPCAGAYAGYPIDQRDGLSLGAHAGESVATREGWTLSTDFGCAFIFTDGVVQAYGILGGEELRALCEEMIARYLEIDIWDLGLQTHATLTALRGLLRFHELHPERADLVAAVAERFELYLTRGMTESWGNHNWFKDPRWTEPCAIVDALQVARQLWQATGDARYRDLVQLTRWNAFAHGQRVNGGFGPDSCVGSACTCGGSEHQLRPSVPEAYWCCSMRGAEGLADLIRHQAVTLGGRLHLPLAESCTVGDEAEGLRVDSAYPWEGCWTIERRGAATTVALAAPDWCTGWRIDGAAAEPVDGWLQVDLPADAAVAVTCAIDIVRQERLGQENEPGWHAWRHGPVMLARAGVDLQAETGTPTPSGERRWRLGAAELIPVSDNWRRPMPVKDQQAERPYAALTQQVLWR